MEHRFDDDKEKVRHSQFTRSGWDGLREWQREALNLFIDKNEQSFSVEAAMGAGKSRFAAFAISYSLNSLELDHAIFVAPWRSVMESFRKDACPLGLSWRDGFGYDKNLGKMQGRPSVDITIGSYSGVCNSKIADVIEYWREKYGFRFVLVLDEIHHAAESSGKWGGYAERIAKLADKVIVMSGTYFRSDSRRISLVRYDDEGKTINDYSIGYAECVAKRYVRQANFRFYTAEVSLLSRRNGKESRPMMLADIPSASTPMITAARSASLRPDGDSVRMMIDDAASDIAKMRTKWPDAACLFVCKSGSQDADVRYIHAIRNKILEVTGVDPVVVTSDDKSSNQAIEHFKSSSDPYICAIRMVSEGVNVPRIRMIVLLTYIESEMLFRQVCGRCIRYIDGQEDGTAAMVMLLRSKTMEEFANRFEAEAKLGVSKIELDYDLRDFSDSYIHEPVSCGKCNQSPCRCCVVLSYEAIRDGGVAYGESVSETYIQKAKLIRDSSTNQQHANIIQIAEVLQSSDRLGSVLVVPDLVDARRFAVKRLERILLKIAEYKYDGDRSFAWDKEIRNKLGVNEDHLGGDMRIDILDSISKTLTKRLVEIQSE